ncbi:MAG: HAMP domain-containing sensor histidine kinase, partial [Geminicoccaceae bacterium]
PPTVRRLGRIRRALDQLVGVIEGNLDRSRLDGATATCAPRPVDPRPVVEAAVEQARNSCGGRPLLVRFESMDEIDRVTIDPQLVMLALVNLIENAAKFSAPAAGVEIVCGGRADGLEIAVLDRGIGVAAEDLPQLKEKYFRGANAAGIAGMGMGLRFVDTIARAHGASLRLEHRDGGGMIATLHIPVAPARHVGRGAWKAAE